MYAGILISALGAVMDVAMSIASTINEIHFRNPLLSAKGIIFSGIRVGKDMMGTMSNTLILAFTGTSINTLVFLYVYNYSTTQIINMYSIGIELIQGIASTMGVILTIPLVSLLSAWHLKRKEIKIFQKFFKEQAGGKPKRRIIKTDDPFDIEFCDCNPRDRSGVSLKTDRINSPAKIKQCRYYPLKGAFVFSFWKAEKKTHAIP